MQRRLGRRQSRVENPRGLLVRIAQHVLEDDGPALQRRQVHEHGQRGGGGKSARGLVAIRHHILLLDLLLAGAAGTRPQMVDRGIVRDAERPGGGVAFGRCAVECRHRPRDRVLHHVLTVKH
jgi:hypothetical protein